MIMGLMYYNEVGPLITVEGIVAGAKYRRLLQNNFFSQIAKRRRKRLATMPVAEEEWKQIPKRIIQSLVKSRSRRMEKAIKAQEFATKY